MYNHHSAAVAPHASRLDASRIAWRTVGVIGFALLTAIGAKVRIPLPDTPVPLTLQTLPVLLAGATLGPWLGAASMALYALLGTVGYAVFATDRIGLATILGPTGGYILGFIAVQFLIGWLTRDARPRPWNTLGVMFLGHAGVFAIGLPWLMAWGGYDLASTLALGLTPFLGWTVVKSLAAWPLATWALRRVRPALDV